MLKWFLKLIARLPLTLNHKLGAFLGRCLYLFSTDVKRISAKNITLCLPHLTQQAQDKLLKQSLIELGKTITESLYVWFIPFQALLQKVEVVNPSLLDTNKRIIFIAPHLGCWELVGSYLSSLHPTTLLYKPLRSKRADALLFTARINHHRQLASADKKGVQKLQKALLSEQWIGLLSDQNPDRAGGVYAPLFGVDALTMTLGIKLATRYQVPIVSIWAERLANGRGFRIHCHQMNEFSNSDTLEHNAKHLNQEIERMILQKPEQYQWGYARFRRDKHDQRTHFYK